MQLPESIDFTKVLSYEVLTLELFTTLDAQLREVCLKKTSLSLNITRLMTSRIAVGRIEIPACQV